MATCSNWHSLYMGLFFLHWMCKDDKLIKRRVMLFSLIAPTFESCIKPPPETHNNAVIFFIALYPCYPVLVPYKIQQLWFFSPLMLSRHLALSSCCISSTKQNTCWTAGVTERIPKHVKLADILKNILRYAQVGKTLTVMQFSQHADIKFIFYHSHSHSCTHLLHVWVHGWH